MIIFWHWAPKEKAWIFNWASVPSTISGIATMVFWKEIRDTNKSLVIFTSIDAEEYNINSIEDINISIKKMLINMQGHVDKEINWDSSKGIKWIWVAANIKNYIFKWKYIDPKRDQVQTKQAYQKYIKNSKFQDNSFEKQITLIQDKYEKQLEDIMNKLETKWFRKLFGWNAWFK